MPIQIRDIRTVDAECFPYIFERDVSINLQDGNIVRCNVYRPKDSGPQARYPVLATYGPYGKDIPYESFNSPSYAEVNPKHKTPHSSWETPTPESWTAHGYIVVRADEIGTGQSPGLLNTLSPQTVKSFCEVIEWASEQEWSTGKVGLLGISYFGATQWYAAARNPKGLAAAVPWEGFSDLYRDMGRHGGILSNTFQSAWWKRQVASNQYGLPGKASRNWGPDTVEGDLEEDELRANRIEQPALAPQYRYADDKIFASMDCKLENIKIPILSVANWGGILLHLRGNVQGFIRAGSEFKYLRFIAGRHDLPFYYDEEVEVQRSFLDAFLKGEDRYGWSQKGAVPPVDLLLRKGDVGYNNPKAEQTFARRSEQEWPIARTEYTKLFLQYDGEMLFKNPANAGLLRKSYDALGTGQSSDMISFTTPPFERETEITGHMVAHLNVSVSKSPNGPIPSDLDLFISLRHISAHGSEILYTGTTGEGAPVTKGFLRVSMRKTNPDHPLHRPWLPYREYRLVDVLPVIADEIYSVDIELWPTNVVVEAGNRLTLEVSSGDTAGTGMFNHNDPIDRPGSVFEGQNHIHFGPDHVNHITLPVIPPLSATLDYVDAAFAQDNEPWRAY
ncbi:uncharacterized protein N7477_001771 [Penicillium maclennaniae]|uniref:uncharacterized protein n=1 Tax=Penicillium maclennaniae TaxID=1343394 RepID=UPI00253FBBF7|nr:uncharacterized protein N7477_001771 [Penicillium maclennaniae]KAJ5681831.1 hypothetical protein N7477_001771 [Penicillium maclennaniae]